MQITKALEETKLALTSSDERSKTLQPIVKETVGMESRLPQSTVDSPIGLGMRSQSYKYIRELNQLQKKLMDTKA